jgi:hypothetical protein
LPADAEALGIPHHTACVRVLQIDGRVNSTHWHFGDALRAALQLKDPQRGRGKNEKLN